MSEHNTTPEPEPDAESEVEAEAGSSTESESESAPESEQAVTIDVEGRQLIEETVHNEERKQVAENAHAESTRRRLLEAKKKREREAEPFEITFDPADPSSGAELDPLFVGETFEFRPFPKELKNAFQEASLEFAGVEDDEDLAGEPAKQIKEMNDRIVDALALYSTDGELNTEFWREMTDMEDRQIMAGQLMAKQGK